MCHLILSTCKIFCSLIFTFADWLDFHHNCLFQPSCACGCKSVLHSSFTSDVLVCATRSPASPVCHVYQPPHQHLWTFSTVSVSGTSFLSWSARLLPFLHQNLFKGSLLPWYLQELFLQLCQGCTIFFSLFFFFFLKYSTSQFLAS